MKGIHIYIFIHYLIFIYLNSCIHLFISLLSSFAVNIIINIKIKYYNKCRLLKMAISECIALLNLET